MTNKARLHVESFDGMTATVKVDYEHIIDALAMYFQTLPIPIVPNSTIIDVDLGVEVDDEGFVTLDLVYAD